MTVKERILMFRLMERVRRNPTYAKKLGVETSICVITEK